jgi:hypothetical protein
VNSGFFLVTVNVQKKLCGLGNGGGGVVGMVIPHDGEISDGLELEQIRAGQHEEVTDHPIAETIKGQVGHGVEHVQPALALLLDLLVNLRDKQLETRFGPEFKDLDAGFFGEKRRVAGKPEIDHFLLFLFRVRAKGVDERRVVGNGVHLPDNIVAGHDAVEHFVQRWQAGAGLGHGISRVKIRKCKIPSVKGKIKKDIPRSTRRARR